MLLVKILRPIFRWIRILDEKNLPLFRFIPSRSKKRFIRKFFGRFTSRLPEVLELNGLKFQIPRTLDYSYVLSEHEPGTQEIIKKHLRPGMVAVDVGSNLGYLTLMMAKRVGPEGRVYAIEPGIENVQLLRKNIQLNDFKNITVLPYAAGAKRESALLHLRKASTLNTLYSPETEGTGTTQTEIAPLDDLIPEEKIDFLKMDIEGGEIDALMGMDRLLRTVTRIVIEWNPLFLQRAGRDPEHLPRLLADSGFRLWVINEKNFQLMSLDEFKQDQNVSRHVNLYCERWRT